MKKIRVLHLFDTYLGSNNKVWLYNLISSLSDCDNIIAAEHYSRHNFYSDRFTFIENPLSGITKYERSIGKRSFMICRKLMFYLAGRILGNYRKFLKEELKKREVDIVHAHFANVGCDHSWVPGLKKAPFLVSFYGYDYEFVPFTQPSYKKLYQRLFDTADQLVCEGTFGASVLEKMGCPPEKIAVLPLGVIIEEIPFSNRSKGKDSLNLVQVAAFREKKGHIYSVKAFHKALAECPHMHLTLVGNEETSFKIEVLEFIKEKGLENKVKVVNGIDHSRLHEFLSGFDVFIHPSCYSSSRDCEGGAPVVLLDAQACGLPVISTTHCDIPDEVIHGVTGFLSSEKDFDSLADSIRIFYSMDPMKFRSFSFAARKHVEENYSIVRNSSRLRELYKAFIKEGKTARK